MKCRGRRDRDRDSPKVEGEGRIYREALRENIEIQPQGRRKNRQIEPQPQGRAKKRKGASCPSSAMPAPYFGLSRDFEWVGWPNVCVHFDCRRYSAAGGPGL